MDDQRHRFSIEPDIMGAKSVKVDDVEIRELLTAVEILIQAAAPPSIVLHLSPTVSTELIEATGIVVATPDDMGATDQFLANIDPNELSNEALKRLDMSGGTPIEKALEVLREWASGGARDGATNTGGIEGEI